MSRMSMVLDELIRDRSMDRMTFSEEMVRLGWEENAEDVMKVLEDSVIPCHDVFWGTEEVLSLTTEELQRLKDAAYMDARDRAKSQKASVPGTSLATALALLLVLFL